MLNVFIEWFKYLTALLTSSDLVIKEDSYGMRQVAQYLFYLLRPVEKLSRLIVCEAMWWVAQLRKPLFGSQFMSVGFIVNGDWHFLQPLG